jgi:hypothetical protein
VIAMAERLRVLVPLARAAAVTAAVISLCGFGAGPASAAATRPIGGEVDSVYCVSVGSCAAVGILYYPHANGPLVVSETRGAWGKAGTVRLPGGYQSAWLASVSCSSTGNCGAGGGIFEKSGLQALVVTERDGLWGTAAAVPGLAALNVGGEAHVQQISCRSAGDCTASGTYEPNGAPGHRVGQVFVVSEKNGTWGQAEPLPGLLALDHGLATTNTALSCVSPGNCTVAGRYGSSAGFRGYADSQKNGVWATVHTFPAIAAGVEGEGIDQLSCQPGGNCTGTGNYFTSAGDYVFAVNETHGAWDAGRLIPGIEAIPGGGVSIPSDTSLSCSSAGDCTAGGEYFATSKSHPGQAWVATETHGTWARALALPGLAALNTGKDSFIAGLACYSTGNCTAAGTYSALTGSSYLVRAFVAAEKNGRWGKPEELPGAAALSTHIDSLTLSCGAPGDCAIAGYYDGKHSQEPFVATEKNGTWTKAERVPGIQP